MQILGSLALSSGAWTLILVGEAPTVLRIPISFDLPAVKLRSSLADLYWPTVELPWSEPLPAVSPQKIWKSSYPLSNVLTVTVLERITAGRERSLTSTCTLAVILGFVGIVDESVALIGLSLWIAFELAKLLRSFHLQERLKTQPREVDFDQLNYSRWPVIVPAAAEPALTIVLLAASGGIVTGLVTGSSHSGLSLMWPENPASRRPLGELEGVSGGVGLLGIGPVVVAAAAVLLAWRNPLVLLLAAGSGALPVAALTLFYEPFPGDITRMDGHARNFALVAVLLALGIRLAALRSGYRYAAAASLIALVTWPTTASSARALSLGLERGVQLSNTSPGPREFHEWFQGRHAVKRFKSDTIGDFIREHTPADARVLSPHPDALTIATGRPNASGFAQLLRIIVGRGSEYKDAIRLLEAAAIRQLGIDYVHATDT